MKCSCFSICSYRVGVLAPFDTQWSLLKLGVVPFIWGTLTVIKSRLSRNHPHLANGIKLPRRCPMTMQSDNKAHGFANSSWMQMGLLAVAAIVLIALAAHYV